MASAISSTRYDGSACGHLIEEVKFLLVSNFFDFKCVFGSRICKKATHELAVLGTLVMKVMRSLDPLPESISVMVANGMLACEHGRSQR